MTVYDLFSTPAITPTASEAVSGFPASWGLDGSTGTYWLATAATPGTPRWLKAELATPKAFVAYALRGHPSSTTYNPKDWILQGSNDNSTWTDLHTVTAASWASTSTVLSYSFSNATTYTYYRLYITVTNGATDYVGVTELTLGGGLTYTASSTVSTFTADKAFDGSGATRWLASAAASSGTPQWLKVQLGTATAVNAYTLRGHPDSTIYNPTAWKVQGSNDNSSWTDLDTRTGVTWAGTTSVNSYTFSNSTAYSYYRLHVTAVNGATDYTSVSEWAGGFDDPGGATAAVAATLPALTSATTGLVDIPAAVAATLPALTASAAATSTATGVIGAALPSLTAAVVATADDTVPVEVAATLPALTASVEAATTYTGEIGAALPALTALAEVTVTNDDPAGPIAATLPALSALVVVDAGSTLDPWVDGAHGEALLNLDSPVGVLEVTYPAEAAPANIVEVPLSWQSHETAVVGGDTSGMESVALGTPHAFVDGVDVTYFRGIPTIIGAPRQEAPFGWTSATLTFPQVFHYEERGTGDLSWMRPDAAVEIAIVTPLGARIHRFTGQLTSEDPGVGRGRTECTWQCEGVLWQAEHAHHPVPARLDPTDSGKLIIRELMGTPSRRFTISGPGTGILERKRGSHRMSRWAYASDLLTTAITEGGDQWTIQPTGKTSFELALKDTTTVHWTITAGAPGVEIDLSKDHHERIDAVYASGVGPDGYAWSNIFFPDILPYDPPAYPYADPDQMFGLGATDAGTLTGTGISDWQRRIRDLGYTAIAIDGVMGSADIAAVRWIQRKRGIQVDGVPGPQTFAATWNIGAVGGDLSTIRLPMAWRSEVEPFLYGANGAVVGTNPDYDPSIIRHEIDVDFGAGVTKEQGREMAQRILERGMDPGWTGTLRLTTCPWEGSRHEINAGDNVLLKGWQGGDVLARVVKVDPDWQSLDTPVTLTIDSEFRDAMAVVEILERNRESRADPARRPGNPNRRSRMDQDMVTPFEGESPAGRLPRLPLFEGLWTVWPVPVSEVGLIAKLRFVTSGPASRFAVALFGKPVTANQIAAKVANPLASTNPWAAAGDDWLNSVGWIEAWGEEGDAAGYGMLGEERLSSPVTGELYDDAGVPFVSQVSPWVWFGLYSPTSCFIEGRAYPDVTQ